MWAQLLVESCGKLVKKLIWAKNNYFFAGVLIQISSLICFAAEPALQMKELLLKAWLVTMVEEWNVPCPQICLAVASSRPSLAPW